MASIVSGDYRATTERERLHISEGLLNVPTVVATNAVSLTVLGIGIRQVERKLSSRRVPLLGMMAAFVFTVQFLAIPVGTAVPIHLTGAVLAAILLGPFSALVIMAAALLVQALFHHGGILTLGANLLNMGIVGCFLGSLIWRLGRKRLWAAAIAAWLSLILGSALAAVELWLSGYITLLQGGGAITGAHLLVGGVETAVTLLILGSIRQIRPDLLEIEKI